MTTIRDLQAPSADALWEALSPRIESCTRLQQAAQRLLDNVYGEFEEALVLARVFLTIPYEKLPKRNKEFARRLAESKGASPDFRVDTPVLSLIGTRGLEAGWNDIALSEEHVGIPLVSPEFVDAIPMVARLLKDLGVGAQLFHEPGDVASVETRGAASGFFHVPDARTSVDGRNRKIIVAQDFVQRYDVHTVFGVGGSYPNNPDNVIVAIFFTHEDVPREVVARFEPLLGQFKAATVGLVAQNSIFA